MNKTLFHLLSLFPFCSVADEITVSILSPIDNNYFDNEIKYSLNGSILSLGNFLWLLTIWLTYDTEIFKFLANTEYDMPKSLCNFYKILRIIYLSFAGLSITIPTLPAILYWKSLLLSFPMLSKNFYKRRYRQIKKAFHKRLCHTKAKSTKKISFYPKYTPPLPAPIDKEKA